MRNIILKMVSKGVISSDNANRLVNMKQDIDPLWKGIVRGYVDEKKLARFFEDEGYPVIYDEGTTVFQKDDIFKFFTPDIIAKYLVFPISYKKDSRDIILGFLNAAHLETVRRMIQHIFPDLSTTYFHVPYSVFRRVVYKNFLFDMSKYASMVIGMETILPPSTQTDAKGSLNRNIATVAERVIIFTIENGSAVFRDEATVNRFPLASLPTIRDGLQKRYLELSADHAVKKLSPTEKILLFTNMGIKRDDRMVIVSADDDSGFFILINPRISRDELIKMLGELNRAGTPDETPAAAEILHLELKK
ncbi:MAG TPA: hypothetical protein PKH10_08670 [bacterium]|nr:hypothetical protein [bacterium]